MIIPLNYIVGWLRRLRYTLRGGVKPLSLEAAFNAGYARACKDRGDKILDQHLTTEEFISELRGHTEYMKRYKEESK